MKSLKELKKQAQKHGERIATVEGRLSVAKTEGWLKRNSHWVTLVAFVFGSGIVWKFMTLTINEQIEEKLHPISENVTAIARQVSEIQGELKRISTLRRIEEAADSPTLLAQNLKSVSQDLIDARNLDIKAPERTLSSLQSSLMKVSDKTPGYWPIVFALIGYRSNLVATVSTPIDSRISVLEDSSVGKEKGGWFQLKGVITNTEFNNARIEFSAADPVTLNGVRFVHCLLIFHGLDVNSPPPAFQKLGRQMLASDIADIKFTSKG